MTPNQITLVQQSFRALAPMADAAGEAFYQRLFELDPSLRPLFGDDIAAQSRKLMQALTMLVHALDRIDTVMPVLQGLGRRHRDYGVTAAHFDTVGQALLWTLEVGLGAAWHEELRDTWACLYGDVAAVMLAEIEGRSPTPAASAAV